MTPLCDLLPIVLAAVRPAVRRSWRRCIRCVRDGAYLPDHDTDPVEVALRADTVVVRTEDELRAALRQPRVFAALPVEETK